LYPERLNNLGTKGLGAGATVLLAKRSPSKIYITGRDEAAAQIIIKEVQEAGSQTEIVFIKCDQTSLASVKHAADTFLNQESRLDVLMANAGVMASPPGLTEDGYEVQFGINHMAHALFVKKLTPILEKTAETYGDARIIILTSLAFVLAPRGYGIVFEEFAGLLVSWGIPTICPEQIGKSIIWTRIGVSFPESHYNRHSSWRKYHVIDHKIILVAEVCSLRWKYWKVSTRTPGLLEPSLGSRRS
jgi:NAD(P)-dependent dehydrogenase (short-subunit alcohol dehydrogenase family)